MPVKIQSIGFLCEIENCHEKIYLTAIVTVNYFIVVYVEDLSISVYPPGDGVVLVQLSGSLP